MPSGKIIEGVVSIAGNEWSLSYTRYAIRTQSKSCLGSGSASSIISTATCYISSRYWTGRQTSRLWNGLSKNSLSTRPRWPVSLQKTRLAGGQGIGKFRTRVDMVIPGSMVHISRSASNQALLRYATQDASVHSRMVPPIGIVCDISVCTSPVSQVRTARFTLTNSCHGAAKVLRR